MSRASHGPPLSLSFFLCDLRFSSPFSWPTRLILLLLVVARQQGLLVERTSHALGVRLLQRLRLTLFFNRSIVISCFICSLRRVTRYVLVDPTMYIFILLA